MERLRLRSGALASVAVVAALVLGSAACARSAAVDAPRVEDTRSSVGSVSAGELQQKLLTKLQEQQTVVDGNAVSCPADLRKEVGHVVRCRYVTRGQPVDLIARVTRLLDDGSVDFEFFTEALPVARSLAESYVANWARENSIVQIDGVSCAGDLQPRVGESVACEVTGGGLQQTVQVVVRAVQGGQITYEITLV